MIDLNDKNRPIRYRFRVNEAEAQAIETLAQAKGVTPAALVREWLHSSINETSNPAQDRAPLEGSAHVSPATTPASR